MGLRTGGAAAALTLVLGVGAGLVAPTAMAEEAPCASEFGNLEAATTNASYTSKRATMDEQGLLDKISAAERKVGQGKLDDAVAKLIDYQGRVETLESAGKITSDADLSALADIVISCVRSLP